MVFVIRKARIEKWGYEITARGFHNIAPTIDAAVSYIRRRFGGDVQIKIKNSEGEIEK